MLNISTPLAHLFPGISFRPGGDCEIDGQTNEITVWRRPEPQPTPAELAAAELPATKAATVAANRAECSRRIFGRYPAGRQLSASFGLYDPANVATMTEWIAANISAENAAADAIEAAATVAEVEAVTVAWPV